MRWLPLSPISDMPHKHSAEALLVRLDRARRLGHLRQRRAGYRHILVPESLVGKMKSIGASMAFHEMHSRLNGHSSHYARVATLQACQGDRISKDERQKALTTHRRANRAKHSWRSPPPQRGGMSKAVALELGDGLDPLQVVDPWAGASWTITSAASHTLLGSDPWANWAPLPRARQLSQTCSLVPDPLCTTGASLATSPSNSSCVLMTPSGPAGPLPPSSGALVSPACSALPSNSDSAATPPTMHILPCRAGSQVCVFVGSLEDGVIFASSMGVGTLQPLQQKPQQHGQQQTSAAEMSRQVVSSGHGGLDAAAAAAVAIAAAAESAKCEAVCKVAQLTEQVEQFRLEFERAIREVAGWRQGYDLQREQGQPAELLCLRRRPSRRRPPRKRPARRRRRSFKAVSPQVQPTRVLISEVPAQLLIEDGAEEAGVEVRAATEEASPEEAASALVETVSQSGESPEVQATEVRVAERSRWRCEDGLWRNDVHLRMGVATSLLASLGDGRLAPMPSATARCAAKSEAASPSSRAGVSSITPGADVTDAEEQSAAVCSTVVARAPAKAVATGWGSELIPPTVRRPWHVFEHETEGFSVSDVAQARFDTVPTRGTLEAFAALPEEVQWFYTEVSRGELAAFVSWRREQTSMTDVVAAWDLLDWYEKDDWIPGDPFATLEGDMIWDVLLADGSPAW